MKHRKLSSKEINTEAGIKEIIVKGEKYEELPQT